MQAVIAGRGRSRQGQGRQIRLYPYISSLSGNEECTTLRCCSLFCFGLSSVSALSGVMLAAFGLTGFFRTNDLNYAFLIVGVALLISSVLLVGIGFVCSRRSQTQQQTLTSQVPMCDDVS